MFFFFLFPFSLFFELISAEPGVGQRRSCNQSWSITICDDTPALIQDAALALPLPWKPPLQCCRLKLGDGGEGGGMREDGVKERGEWGASNTGGIGRWNEREEETQGDNHLMVSLWFLLPDNSSLKQPCMWLTQRKDDSRFDLTKLRLNELISSLIQVFDGRPIVPSFISTGFFYHLLFISRKIHFCWSCWKINSAPRQQRILHQIWSRLGT